MNCARAATITIAPLLILSTACSTSDITVPEDPLTIVPVAAGGVTGGGYQVLDPEVGTTLPAPVEVRVVHSDRSPAPGVRVVWRASGDGTLAPETPVTDADGVSRVRWTLGTTAGLQELHAEVQGSQSVLAHSVTARAGSVARIVFPVDTFRISLIGDTVSLSASPVDRYGNPAAEVLDWQLQGPGEAIELLQGGRGVVALSRGTAAVVASSGGVAAAVTVRVEPLAPRPLRVLGDTIVPGVPFTVIGGAFSPLKKAVELDVAGAQATVLTATGTRIEAVLPKSMLPCMPTELKQLRVTIGGASGELEVPVRTATRLKLKKGESASLLDSGSSRCVELVSAKDGSPSRYIVAVLNTSTVASSVASFELKGRATGAFAGRMAEGLDARAAADGVTTPAASKTPALPPALLEAAKAEQAHAGYLERERSMLTRAGSPSAAWARAGRSRAAAERGEPRQVGDVVTVQAFYDRCSAGREVTARVVYAGTKALVLEDVTSPKAGMMDAQYRAIGEEFDRVQYPILKDNLGDPLAMSGTLAGDGRVTMLFTRYVNDSVPGIAGYVSACNFYPRSVFPASNETELFYARVPAPNESAAEWRRSMRSTVIHEAKHLASFAERMSRGMAFEETWLEEATARIAEELYSRTFPGGGSWKGNAGYTGSVRCEVYQCDDRPVMMWKHFSALHTWATRVDELTPIGAAVPGDYSYYASGWSLVRWAADHYAANEGEWLKALVRGGAGAGGGDVGLENLARRTGRSAEEILADWALATAVSSEAGFSSTRDELTMPSWDVRDIMAGLARTYPGMFRAEPLKVQAGTFGEFALSTNPLHGFSARYLSLEGDGHADQLLEMGGAEGRPAAAGIKLAVLRVR